MYRIAMPLLLVAVVLLPCTVRAADPPRKAAASTAVSADLLQQMGLGGMQSVSDSDGLQVRGKGLRVTSQNLAAVTGVRFGGVYIFQKINVYYGSGSRSYNNVILP